MATEPRFIYELPAAVLWQFCRVMDGLTDLDWTRFASEVLSDQTCVRLAERKERRTECVINQWGSRNGRVDELIDLLQRLQLYRACDVIVGYVKPKSSNPNANTNSNPPLPRLALPMFDHAPKLPQATPTQTTCIVKPVERVEHRPLPRPAPPPSCLQSHLQQPAQCPPVATGSNSSNSSSSSNSSGGVMCWSYEEVHCGTEGFSPARQVGEGGFGVVYRATMRNTDCAVKRLKQDSALDWTQLRQSFETEVDKLTKFRHPNIVDLLGVSEGPQSVCLIYSYMENRSLEDQLHNECVSLSWLQRVSIVEGASAALQFLHCPPEEPLIHGDVKSSNILLDRHLVAKLADFGLARCASRGVASGRSANHTATVGKTATVRGTLAYLPDEYWRHGELGTATDVYSYGVVLLEVLTGRRALEKDKKTRERYLKDLVDEVDDGPSGSTEETWRQQLDQRLLSGGGREPAGCMEVAALACRCLDKKRKKRPNMTRVFEKLQDVHSMLRKTLSPPSPPSPPRPTDSSLEALSNQLSAMGPLSNQLSSMGPLEHAYHPSGLYSNSNPNSSSSVGEGPCETDESRGFSQYHQFNSNRTSKDSVQCAEGSTQSRPASIPTEDQFHFPPHTHSASLSPVGSLHSVSPANSAVNQQKKNLEDKRQPSSEDLYRGSSVEARGPEESDELDYLQTQHH